MLTVQNGQCGLCRHFGEYHPGDRQVVEIHVRQEAPEDYVDDCGHPRHAPLNLRVTAVSGCDGYEPVTVNERASVMG